MNYFIGIDGGGTKSRLLAVDKNNKNLGVFFGETTNVASNSKEVVLENLKQLFNEFFEKTNSNIKDCSALCIGSAGVDTGSAKETIIELMQQIGFSCPIKVVNDAEIVLATETQGEPGLILIAGTGSIAYGVNEKGETLRAGGWGHLLGDEGSGYHIAKEGIAAALKSFDKTGQHTIIEKLLCEKLEFQQIREILDFVYFDNASKSQLAALCTVVFEAQKQGDVVASKIINKEIDCLYETAVAIIETLDLKHKPYKLVFSGGVFANVTQMRKQLSFLIKGKYPNIEPVLINKEPAFGAIYIAQKFYDSLQ